MKCSAEKPYKNKVILYEQIKEKLNISYYFLTLNYCRMMLPNQTTLYDLNKVTTPLYHTLQRSAINILYLILQPPRNKPFKLNCN